MPFNAKPQKFTASINTVEIGVGEKAIKIGGENVFPLYSFDAPIENAPKVGVLLTDAGLASVPALKSYYGEGASLADMAKKVGEMEGADFIYVSLEGGDPNGENKSIEELVAAVNEIAGATDMPLVVAGCKNVDKDAELLPKVAEALQGKNVVIMPAKEENYKAIGAAAGLAYNQKLGAESAVDINLAKQLNVVTTQLGVKAESIIMNIGTATAGYGYEYVVSTMDRIKAAALSQDDAMLQMPILTPVATETYGVKESIVSEEDFPEWGPVEERGIAMEIMTASADLASGSNAVVLQHPKAVATIAKMIKELV